MVIRTFDKNGQIVAYVDPGHVKRSKVGWSFGTAPNSGVTRPTIIGAISGIHDPDGVWRSLQEYCDRNTVTRAKALVFQQLVVNSAVRAGRRATPEEVEEQRRTLAGRDLFEDPYFD